MLTSPGELALSAVNPNSPYTSLFANWANWASKYQKIRYVGKIKIFDPDSNFFLREG